MANLGKLVSDLQFAYKQPSPDAKTLTNLFTKFQIELIKSYNSLKTQQEFVNASLVNLLRITSKISTQ